MPSLLRTFALRLALAAAALLVWLGPQREAHGQISDFGLNWFRTAFISDWLTQYWTDFEAEEDPRLATLPDMFGDSFARGGVLTTSNTTPLVTHSTDVLLAGGTRGLKVAEHNKAIPMNRVYLAYNHFHNAAASSTQTPPLAPIGEDLSIDRYTLGVESRFADGLWSLEFQLPLAGDLDVIGPAGLTESHGGQIGNLSAVLKRLLYYNGQTSLAGGLGIETPTGSDFASRTAVVAYQVSNDAVHLHPYLAVLHSPDECLFFHGFVQLDVATHGNRVTFDDTVASGNVAGRYNDQTLLYVDLGGGYWLWRDPCASYLTGLAALAEVHYTTTLNDTDALSATPVGAGGGGHLMNLTNPANRMDVVNLTAALHAELAPFSSLRIGGTVPVSGQDNRFFDGEIAVQWIRQF